MMIKEKDMKQKQVAVVEPEENLQAIEEAGIGFDPTRQHLDLSKEEKRRTTSLLLAIQAYDKLIIKDAEMYIAISRDAGREDGPKIRPATIDAIVEASIKFDLFISGAFDSPPKPTEERGEP